MIDLNRKYRNADGRIVSSLFYHNGILHAVREVVSVGFYVCDVDVSELTPAETEAEYCARLLQEAHDACKRYGVDITVIELRKESARHKITKGMQYKTRDGEPVTILTTTAPSESFPVIGHCADGEPETWSEYGEYGGSEHPSDFDLVLDDGARP